jgi:hypothetical protein
MPIVTMPNGDRVQFPDSMSKDQIKEKIRSKFPDAGDSGWDTAKGAVTGFGRGVAKGVTKLADEIPTLGLPHVGELDPRVKQFEDSPDASTSESIGSFAGQNAPFLIGGPEAAIGKGVAKAIPFAGRMAGPVGEFVGNTLWGGVAGAAQPTKEGESRLANAAGGATMAGVLSPRIAGRFAGLAGGAGAGLGIEHLISQFGFWPVMGAIGGLGIGGLGHFGLHGLATRAARMAQGPGKVIAHSVPAGVAGATGGRAMEAGQENMDGNGPGPAQGQ